MTDDDIYKFSKLLASKVADRAIKNCTTETKDGKIVFKFNTEIPPEYFQGVSDAIDCFVEVTNNLDTN